MRIVIQALIICICTGSLLACADKKPQPRQPQVPTPPTQPVDNDESYVPMNYYY